ncbi:hypothetical protein FM103_01515 [Corynebacterium xerosis]|nr:hypothetical protein FM103_01515 [Corynebacterium xerosis]
MCSRSRGRVPGPARRRPTEALARARARAGSTSVGHSDRADGIEVHEDVGGRRPNCSYSSGDRVLNLLTSPFLWRTRPRSAIRRAGTASGSLSRASGRGPIRLPG